MTLENLLSHMGIGTNQISERYSEYAPPTQDQHVYYAYEPATPHGHVPHVTTSSKHKHGSGFKSNASMSALTLLAFLFFLHILQQCIKEHMTDLNTSPLMVMTAGRENDDNISNAVENKLEKIDLTPSKVKHVRDKNNRKSTEQQYNARNPFTGIVSAMKNNIRESNNDRTIN